MSDIHNIDDERLWVAERRGVVAIVDPFSSGAMLADALRARHTDCVAVLSSPGIPEAMRTGFNPTSFRAVIEHRGSSRVTIDALRQHAPHHVVPGFESGVELADILSERMSLPTNGTALSPARRDKFLMLETARGYGLATPRQFRSSDREATLDWIRSTVGWPVILKPAASVASDNVHRCVSVEDVERAWSAILHKPNVLGASNDGVLTQEFLGGREYVVDTVSVNGHRKTTAFWVYDRPGGDPAAAGYEAMTLLPYEGERQDRLTAFAGAAQDALGIDFGPGHCEIMWVADRPVLIEVGARLSAGINAVLSRICGGICQLDETVDAIQAPDRFLATLDRRPSLSKWAVNVFLIPPRRGRLTRVQGLDIIEQLATLHDLSVRRKPGDILNRVAGLVTLVADDPEAIARDIRTIRAVERRGLFQVRPLSEPGGADHSRPVVDSITPRSRDGS